jgi:hypothetical protein
MFKLAEEHQNKAIEIIERHKLKKTCNVCYDRGYVGHTLENLVIPCHKCVDNEAIMKEWKEYVAQVPELREFYHEMFEEEHDDEEAEKDSETKDKKKIVEELGLKDKSREKILPGKTKEARVKNIEHRSKNR